MWLTNRQREILRLRRAGLTWRDIGLRLGVGHATCYRQYRAALARYTRRPDPIDARPCLYLDDIDPMRIVGVA
jgi:hypothetical protein